MHYWWGYVNEDRNVTPPAVAGPRNNAPFRKRPCPIIIHYMEMIGRKSPTKKTELTLLPPSLLSPLSFSLSLSSSPVVFLVVSSSRTGRHLALRSSKGPVLLPPPLRAFNLLRFRRWTPIVVSSRSLCCRHGKKEENSSSWCRGGL